MLIFLVRVSRELVNRLILFNICSPGTCQCINTCGTAVSEMKGAFLNLSRLLGCLGAISRRVGTGAELSRLRLPSGS